jgi:hypothetical protein
MSIATLKRKTNATYKNVSSGKQQFSLHGGTRSQGFIGQDTLGRSLPTQNMRGDTLMGHGGCCGNYHVIKAGIMNYPINDPTIMKPSVVGTSGMMMKKYRWIRRPAPYSVVKPDNTLNLNTQGQYVDNIVKAATDVYDTANEKYKVNGVYVKSVPCATCSNSIFTKSLNTCTIAKPTDINSAGLYLKTLDKKCETLDVYGTGSNIQGSPFVSNSIVATTTTKNCNATR